MSTAIREYEPTDEDQLFELYSKAFSAETSELFRQRWQWEFEGPPALRRFANLVAERDHRLVAHVGRLSVRLAVGDTLVPAVFLSDVMADQGRAGLSILQLVKKSLDEVPVVLHFGGQPGAGKQIYERLGMRTVAIGEILLRVERPAGALAALAHRRLGPRGRRFVPRWLFAAPGALLAPACAVRYRWGARLPAGEYAVTPVSDFDDRFDDLWTAMRATCPVMCARDRAFLHWRYREAPAGTYRVLALTRADGSLAAASVLTEAAEGPARLGKLMECLYADEDALAATINASIAAFRAMGVDMIMSAGLSPRARELLRAVGFRPYRQRSFMLKSSLGAAPEALLHDPSCWYISSGDGDEDFERNVDAV
ncbi:MAG TPA: GNAT family N-acetyltransferase [Candidatus Limnocylindria bacterium]|jgi:hypothetical protein|nr:GNAT family N-acetyltransferase [Candidatus Limnocylindria bacterium]